MHHFSNRSGRSRSSWNTKHFIEKMLGGGADGKYIWPFLLLMRCFSGLQEHRDTAVDLDFQVKMCPFGRRPSTDYASKRSRPTWARRHIRIHVARCPFARRKHRHPRLAPAQRINRYAHKAKSKPKLEGLFHNSIVINGCTWPQTNLHFIRSS